MGDNSVTYYVLFPAYNEQKVIAKVLKETHELFTQNQLLPLEIVVVDDGSQDSTADIVRSLQPELPITLLQHAKNRGLGGALKTGLLYVIHRADEQDVILTSESDGCQDLSKLVQLANQIKNGAELAVATPLIGEGYKGVPFYRRFLSKGGNIVYGVLFPIDGLNDYTNMNRAYKAKILKQALSKYGEDKFIDRTGFEAVPDIVLKLRDQKLSVKEVPIVIDFTKTARPSSMHVINTILNSLKLCWDHLFKIKV
jgi:dolichol-phosphate mannosyltransferase